MSGPLRQHLGAAVRRAPAPIRHAVDALLRRRDVRSAKSLVPRMPSSSDVRLLIGPMNTAGQAHLWSRAAQEHLVGVTAFNVVAERNGRVSGFGYQADIIVPSNLQTRGLPGWEAGVLSHFTHVVLEMGRGVTRDFFDIVTDEMLTRYREAGVDVAILLHGSEIRDHTQHAAMYEASPFENRDEYLDKVQARVDEVKEFLERTDLPLFVPTLDLMDFVGEARWLPLTAEVARFAAAARSAAAPLARDIPVVLHAPSNPLLKGTAAVEAVASKLHREGLIEYRRIEGVPHAQMPEFVADADIVIDQVVLGNIATLAAEAMAAGRLVVAHVHERVVDRWRAYDSTIMPIVDATPSNLEATLRSILDDRPRFQNLASMGPRWARTHHDGRASAAALATFLGVDAAAA